MKNTKVAHVFLSAVFAVTALCLNFSFAFATNEDTTFQVNVKEVLSVSVSTPTSWATGDMDTFLRNKVSISVTSNNSAGFTASMTTKTSNTSLVNASKSTFTLPTLDTTNYPLGVARSSFPANFWGYSLDDTDAGNSASTYKALVGAGSTPITILSSDNATTGSKDFYFGAKADVTQAAGSYIGTVVISVVSGVDDNNNPVTPTNPVNPSNNEVAIYNTSPIGGSSNGTTSYTYRNTSGGVSTTTTEVSDGNNVSVYDGYTPPQGVTYDTMSSINGGSGLAGGLSVAASIAAASGVFFFILAKRKDDDEEDEEEESQL